MQSLMRAPLLLTSMVSLSPSVIIQVSISSKTFRCCPHPRNNCAEKLYGWKDYEAIGRCGVDLLVDDFTGTSINKMMECLKSGQSWSDQFPSMKRSSDDELVGVTSVSWSDIYGHSN